MTTGRINQVTIMLPPPLLIKKIRSKQSFNRLFHQKQQRFVVLCCKGASKEFPKEKQLTFYFTVEFPKTKPVSETKTAKHPGTSRSKLFAEIDKSQNQMSFGTL